ncbi:MAG TPA: DUF1343 domain-containing protein [Candidatus Wallbacteria bacterium]|nr:DUF1343 domain-containing protein [Candidatus Wallbacteria bacterium]
MNVGLISNSSAVTGSGTVNLSAMLEAGINVKCVFSPEHGYFANVRDGEYIKDGKHPELELPIFSLFTEGHDRNAIADNAGASGLDLLIFDIQDVGVRFYTYIHALGIALAASARCQLPLIVLDRPNPVSCAMIEGCVPEPEYVSELCPYLIPERYAMTIGELARYLSAHVYGKARLSVIPVLNYRPEMYYQQTALLWRNPSPAMVSPETALFYPGTCFFEGTNLSEGRGTAAPFQTIGSPFADGKIVAEKMREILSIKEFSGISVAPREFIPKSSKFENTKCSGVFLSAPASNFRSMLFGILLLKIFHDNFKSDFKFIVSPKSGVHFFDRLAGGAALRNVIENGSVADILALFDSWKIENEKFAQACSKTNIYKRFS